MIKRICKICKKVFKTYLSKIKLGRGKYCSRKCSNKITLIKKGQHFSFQTEFKKNHNICQTKNWIKAMKKLNGKNNSNWNGGRTINDQGYIFIYSPKHPYKDHHHYVREHRLVIEKEIGRFLHKIEVVHHINEITNDNQEKNLMLFKNNVIHRRFHKGLKISSNDILFDGSKEVMPECPHK